MGVVHARVYGERSADVGTTVWVHMSEININLHKIATKFVPIWYEFIRIYVYGSPIGLLAFATSRLGRRLAVVGAFGAGLALNVAE